MLETNRTYANQLKFAPQPPILRELEIKVPQNWGIYEELYNIFIKLYN